MNFISKGLNADLAKKITNLKIRIQHNLNTENSNDPNNLKKLVICSMYSSFVDFLFIDFYEEITDEVSNIFDSSDSNKS